MDDDRHRTVYWHGLGRCPDPAAVTVIYPESMLGEQEAFRREKVPGSENYVHASPAKEVAIAFSVLGGGYAVCQIDPGTLPCCVDTDFPTLGVQFRGPVHVLSTELIDRAALPNARQITKTLASDYLWPDGSSRYVDTGHLRTPPSLLHRGYVDSDFEWLGRWYPLDFLHAFEEGQVMALTGDGHYYLMFPPGFPQAEGRRCVPAGTVEHAWNEPGYFPAREDTLMNYRIRVKWEPEKLTYDIHLPWEEWPV